MLCIYILSLVPSFKEKCRPFSTDTDTAKKNGQYFPTPILVHMTSVYYNCIKYGMPLATMFH